MSEPSNGFTSTEPNVSASLRAYTRWLQERGFHWVPTRALVSTDDPETTPPSTSKQCESCPLHNSKSEGPWGVGGEHPLVLFLGEVPEGDPSQEKLEPFTGEARQLLERIIAAMKLTPDQVHFANLVCCRMPPGKALSREAVQACRDHADSEIAKLQPRVIITLGQTAAHVLLDSQLPFSDLRGRLVRLEKYPFAEVMATLHPRDLLRFPAHKAGVWADLQRVMRRLEETAAQQSRE